MSNGEQLGSPVHPAPPFDPDRARHPGDNGIREHTEAQGLPAGRRGSLSVVDFVKAAQAGEFHDVDAADVLVTPEDQLVAKLALAISAALGPSLKPSAWGLTKETPALLAYARQVQLATPYNAGGVLQLFGADRDRRSLRVWTGNAGGVLIAQDRYLAESGQGALLPTNVVLTLTDYAGPLWVAGPAGTAAAFVVSGFATGGEVRNVPRLGSLRDDFQGDEGPAS